MLLQIFLLLFSVSSLYGFPIMHMLQLLRLSYSPLIFCSVFVFFFFPSVFFSLHFLVLEISTIRTSGSKILSSAVSRLLIKLSKAFFMLYRFFYFKYFISILRIFLFLCSYYSCVFTYFLLFILQINRKFVA